MATNDIERYVRERSRRDPELAQAWEDSRPEYEALRQEVERQQQRSEHLPEGENLVTSSSDLLPTDNSSGQLC